jgi:hypothetical protein
MSEKRFRQDPGEVRGHAVRMVPSTRTTPRRTERRCVDCPAYLPGVPWRHPSPLRVMRSRTRGSIPEAMRCPFGSGSTPEHCAVPSLQRRHASVIRNAVASCQPGRSRSRATPAGRPRRSARRALLRRRPVTERQTIRALRLARTDHRGASQDRPATGEVAWVEQRITLGDVRTPRGATGKVLAWSCRNNNRRSERRDRTTRRRGHGSTQIDG